MRICSTDNREKSVWSARKNGPASRNRIHYEQSTQRGTPDQLPESVTWGDLRAARAPAPGAVASFLSPGSRMTFLTRIFNLRKRDGNTEMLSFDTSP